MTMGRVANKVAIVTGGGGRGIGGAISLGLAKEGAIVVVVDVDTKAGQETVDHIISNEGEACFIGADVTMNSNVLRMVDEVIETYGKVDVLINSAGRALSRIRFHEIDEANIERDIALNLKSAVYCTKAVLPHMMRIESGSVVYISSVNAVLGLHYAIYSSAKVGLHSLARTLTSEYSRHGLRFNVVCPGSIPESWPRSARFRLLGSRRLAKRYPLKRLGKPIDVAYAVLFLASDEAAWITGIVLPVDGGITATGGL